MKRYRLLRSYITIAVRHLLKHRVYAVLNVVSLAVGLACAILILSYIRYELVYDAHNEHYDRIARIIRETRAGDGLRASPATSGALAPALQAEFPEVELAARDRLIPTLHRTPRSKFRTPASGRASMNSTRPATDK